VGAEYYGFESFLAMSVDEEAGVDEDVIGMLAAIAQGISITLDQGQRGCKFIHGHSP
jgi:hypothetical protein